MGKEQISFNFESEKEPTTPPAEKNEQEGTSYHFAEKDECQYCGNPFESASSCRYCSTNPEKISYLEKLRKAKN